MIIFTKLADWLIFRVFQLSEQSRLGQSLHFFVEDVTKIFTLLFLMIYIISLLRASLNTEKLRDYLKGKPAFLGYSIASGFGAISPFCSCSSIPLFMGFTAARIPIGITMAFLITSPIVNEVALVLLGTMLGWKFMVVYLLTGILSGIIGGFILDQIGAEAYLTPLGSKALEIEVQANGSEPKKLSMRDRHNFAKQEVLTIVKRLWLWIILGIGVGAGLHGYVPEDFFYRHLGQGQWWTVPAAVLMGIPLYASASGVIPVVHSLIAKGLPLGTAMALMMSIAGASLPEFTMLKQVMKPRLLLIFFFMLLCFFTISGWLMNWLF